MKYECPWCEKLYKSKPILVKHMIEADGLKDEYKYLIDKDGKEHLSCLSASEVDHKCPAHPKI